MSTDEINAFIHPFKPDIRQSTLQLQYILSTGEIDQVISTQTGVKFIPCLIKQNMYLENAKQAIPNKFKFNLVELAAYDRLSVN